MVRALGLSAPGVSAGRAPEVPAAPGPSAPPAPAATGRWAAGNAPTGSRVAPAPAGHPSPDAPAAPGRAGGAGRARQCPAVGRGLPAGGPEADPKAVPGRRLAAALPLALLVPLLLAGCAPAAPPPLVDAGQCRRLALVDEAGRTVVGAEDLALDAEGGRLFVSAQDRLAVEARLGRRGDPPPPAGGLYALPLASLSAEGPLRVADLAGPALGAATRPHGIAFARGADGRARLALVARDAVRDEAGRWRLAPRAVVLAEDAGGGWRPERTAGGPALCHLNDVALTPGGRLLATLDRGPCPGEGRGALVELGPDGTPPRNLAGGYRFANGLAFDADGRLWLAETRAARLRAPAGGLRRDLPGHPDNLALAPDGRLLVALHPSLLRLALHRYGWPLGGRAPSRIVALDPETARVTTLFDDPGGRVFPGATVAVIAGDRLVVGAVRAPGLLVCPLPAGAQAGAGPGWPAQAGA